MRLLRLLLLLLPAGFVAAQTTNQCPLSGSASSTAASTSLDNRLRGCYNWRFTYVSTGFSALSIQVEGSPDNSTWTALTVVTGDGANPATNTGYATAGFHINPSYIRVNLTSATGSGLVNWQLTGTAGAAPTATLASGGGVSTVTASAPLASSGGANPNLTCTLCLFGSATNHGPAIGSATEQLSFASPGTAGQVLTSNGPSADPSFQAATGGVTSVTGTAPVVSSGGATPALSCPTCVTGTPTNHGPMLGGATQAATYASPGTAGQVLTSNGPSADPSFQAAAAAFITSLTTTGSSGPATVLAGVLNVPQYAGGASTITFGQGTFASLPSCTNVLNEIYVFTDSTYQQANCLLGASAWTYFHGGRAVVPPTGFTDISTTNSTASTVNGGITVVALPNAAYGTEIAYPGGSFTRIFGIRFASYQNQFTGLGMYIRDSVGLGVRAFQFMTGFNAPSSNTPSLYLAQCTSFYSGCGSNIITSNYFVVGAEIWFRLTDDGATTRTWSWSVDGITWITVLSEGRTVGVTPNKIGFVADTASGTSMTGWFFHYGPS